jgi:hypothetical protein
MLVSDYEIVMAADGKMLSICFANLLRTLRILNPS